MQVIIAAQNASTRFGGEAILPWHYFRLLRKRGVDARLVVHERTRDELLSLLPQEAKRMHFVPDQPIQRALDRLGRPLPARIAAGTTGLGVHVATSLMQRTLVRELVRKHGADVIHEPIPVSPKTPSFMFGLGAPVVIGPMNGGMDFPPAFTVSQSLLERAFVHVGREVSQAMNVLVPGKRQAAVLLTANERTRKALPRTDGPRVVELVENGVDLTIFAPPDRAPPSEGSRCRFAFVGRLVDWKRVDLLFEALAKLSSVELHIMGDGPMRTALRDQSQALGLSDRVVFHGWVSQPACSVLLESCDALVLPSMLECGGAVVLEAMAMGLPVIAAKWGGPADYLSDQTGILVEPTSHLAFVDELARAMERLAGSRDLRASLGRAGRLRVDAEFDWERKIDRILEIYAEAANKPKPAVRPIAETSGAVTATPFL